MVLGGERSPGYLKTAIGVLEAAQVVPGGNAKASDYRGGRA